ncbi:MAG: methyltransferase [Bacteroidetes bacterium]|nr:methyltransferase [Bacteroidota bacterium]MBS1650045.1 methyltransferase [Bacteroidota bacterium]
MSNHYFQFKQFIVQQENCAMKVTTDACLFGAWVANKIEKLKLENVLDIGAGTGLLSLMLAQKTKAFIQSIEVDEQATIQAEQNFRQSCWSDRLQTHYSSIQNFTITTNQQFDFIIANPPFYEHNLKSNDKQKNMAHHSTLLSLDVLMNCIKKLLSSKGYFAVLLPYARADYFLQLAKDFCLVEKMNVKQTPNHSYFRSMLLFRMQPVHSIETNIVIKQNNDAYSFEFSELLKDYYLYL